MKQQLDFDLVIKRELEVCEAHGFAKPTSNGGLAIDEEAMKDRLFDVITSNHLVTSQDELAALAFTNSEIYAEMFADGPGVNEQPASAEDDEVRDRLTRKIYNWAGTTPSSTIQKRLEAEGFTAVLCQASVPRKIRYEETGKSKAVMVDGRFITDTEELILTHYTGPLAAKLARAADSVRKSADLAIRRHGEITGRVAKQIGTGMAQAAATLKPITEASNPAPAITSGTDN